MSRIITGTTTDTAHINTKDTDEEAGKKPDYAAGNEVVGDYAAGNEVVGTDGDGAAPKRCGV
jgi:hypothetical protein